MPLLAGVSSSHKLLLDGHENSKTDAFVLKSRPIHKDSQNFPSRIWDDPNITWVSYDSNLGHRAELIAIQNHPHPATRSAALFRIVKAVRRIQTQSRSLVPEARANCACAMKGEVLTERSGRLMENQSLLSTCYLSLIMLCFYNCGSLPVTRGYVLISQL